MNIHIALQYVQFIILVPEVLFAGFVINLLATRAVFIQNNIKDDAPLPGNPAATLS